MDTVCRRFFQPDGFGGRNCFYQPQKSSTSYGLRFAFKASNNEAEYEALIADLSLALEMKAEKLAIFSDSSLVISQVRGDYQAKTEIISQYLAHAKTFISKFKVVELNQIPRVENTHVDALTKLASSSD